MPTAPVTARAPAAPRRKGQITAARILDAAEELFSERGYAGTTLRDVAERVGLRIPSLYNHFDSKDSLYAAVLERGIGPVRTVLSEYMEEGRDAYRDSARVVERIMALLEQRPNLPRLVLHETLSGGQRLTPMLREWIEPIFARAHEMVEAGPAAHRWEKEQIPLLVLAMYHVVVGHFTIAPFYRELSGEDLIQKQALARQTRFLRKLVAILFAEEE
ncbi:MAG: TetR/AcrR family transcriptional regulator [Myxococcales bacterium]|nr:TetR/AcrR family transcriptional regulator [Myxococcales bacterium]